MFSQNIHNHKPHIRGFTLIELLTVISIIGLLSSIILASLNSARKKAQDAAIISDLRGFMSEAELSRMNIGNYSDIIAPTGGNYTSGQLPYKMWQGIKNAGGNVSCFSAADLPNPSNPTVSGELNLRWACSATNSDKSILWSVSSESNRVVIWENQVSPPTHVWESGSTKPAIDHCIDQGQRLPTLEELWTAYKVVGTSGGAASFTTTKYWSSTEYTLDINSAWNVYTSYDRVSSNGKHISYSVRCVR